MQEPQQRVEPAQALFGDRLSAAQRFAELLTEHGVQRGLIGPREVERLWDRHLLNSAVIAELLPPQTMVVDVGSGAGFPGIPLAIARPDLRLTLLEPMARRVAWLQEVVTELELSVEVQRGRAEERSVRQGLAGQDVVVARAVAPMERLAAWCLPLARPGGRLLAMKGSSASEELARDRAAIQRVGGDEQSVISCGDGVLATPTNVVMVRRAPDKGGRPAAARDRQKQRRTRKDHSG